jgi:hypothetical protein
MDIAPITVRAHDAAALDSLAGKDLEPSGWQEVTQGRVDTFADAANDRHWVHEHVLRIQPRALSLARAQRRPYPHARPRRPSEGMRAS